ncbi:hypothetical protein BO86DRAFT_145003 [Aspergillus japonicus CBS 114.51]|uniref:Uncharacterized protein n=1 Tax=Aspergillus japonicus CBS 114.51 TaxID=1448312 RepID=A0A8T8WW09_ASPJA|nr:hypothetical protein BO86DRAFT_145003 [Aspergillus japonicus CBS 114.51]RAH79830.1 hypothetical protein BO86DRAFT_145003 [Aspergillus japonicus CBS 114.51]
MRSEPDIRVQQSLRPKEPKGPWAELPLMVPVNPTQFLTGRGKTPHRSPCVDKRTQDTKRSPRPGSGFRRNTQNAESKRMKRWPVEPSSTGRIGGLGRATEIDDQPGSKTKTSSREIKETGLQDTKGYHAVIDRSNTSQEIE